MHLTDKIGEVHKTVILQRHHSCGESAAVFVQKGFSVFGEYDVGVPFREGEANGEVAEVVINDLATQSQLTVVLPSGAGGTVVTVAFGIWQTAVLGGVAVLREFSKVVFIPEKGQNFMALGVCVVKIAAVFGKMEGKLEDSGRIFFANVVFFIDF